MMSKYTKWVNSQLTHPPRLICVSLSFCSCLERVKRQRCEGKKQNKSKAKAKQTAGMRSRRKPVKPGDWGQTSQIHITKRSYKSSRGGVSVDPEKINPGVTIQGHQHGTHGGQSRSGNKATRTKSTSIIHEGVEGRWWGGWGGGSAHHIGGNTMCLCGHTHTHSLFFTHWRGRRVGGLGST